MTVGISKAMRLDYLYAQVVMIEISSMLDVFYGAVLTNRTLQPAYAGVLTATFRRSMLTRVEAKIEQWQVAIRKSPDMKKDKYYT